MSAMHGFDSTIRKSLDASTIVTVPTLTRRRALTLALAFGAIGCRSAASVAVQPNGGTTTGAEPAARSGVTDHAEVPDADPIGNGQGHAGSARAVSDSDSGPNADRGGRPRPMTDSDSGPNADRAGSGGTGISDSDAGPGSDPAGRGGTHSLSLPDDPV